MDEAFFEGDGGSEEEGVQRGAVEAFANVRAGSDDKQGQIAVLGIQAGEGGGAGLGAHAAAQHYGVVAVFARTSVVICRLQAWSAARSR